MNRSELQSIVNTRGLLDSHKFKLHVMQEPNEGRGLAKHEKARGAKWPLDPPPVIEFWVEDDDKSKSFLHSPFWFCTVELDAILDNGTNETSNALIGTTVSSLHKVKLNDNSERGLFVFGDLNIKHQGLYRLRFSLFEMRQRTDGMCAEKLTTVCGNPIKVLSPKVHIPQRESTMLSKTLSEAGVKLRIRKESTKRRAHLMDWSIDKPHQVALPGHILPPPYGVMPPPARPLQQTAVQYQNAGENVQSRLSIQGTSLGIRDHIDKTMEIAQNRPGVSYRRGDAMIESHQNWQAPSWNPEQMQNVHASPPNFAHGGLRQQMPGHSGGGHSQTHSSIPPSPYNMAPANHMQWEQSHFRNQSQQVIYEQPQQHAQSQAHVLAQPESAQSQGFSMQPHHDPSSLNYGVAAAYPYNPSSRSYPISSAAGAGGSFYY